MARYRKKLIEVALPLKAINEASAREKSIRHGHPSTLHLWWARRPLAACRAVLFASLVDDPDSDPQFQNSDGSVDDDAAASKRAALFSLIEELVQWENSNNPEVIRSARAEIARCAASRKVELGELSKDHHLTPDYTVGRLIRDSWVLPRAMGREVKKGAKGKAKTEARVRYTFSTTHLPPESVVNDFLATHAPPVLDPFAGGGSIPLEAQRLGLRAYASDLNPVAVLINKALIEIPPKFAGRPPVNPKSQQDPKTKAREWRGAEGLAEDVRYYGKWMRDEAEKRIGHLYPKVKVTQEMVDGRPGENNARPDLEPHVGEELTVIAWLWARTVASPNPAVGGAHVPLVRSYWLSTKKGKEAWVEPITAEDGMSYRFAVRVGAPIDKAAIEEGTKLGRGCKFKCLLSEQPIDENHIKQAGKDDELGARLLAIVAEGNRGRVYLAPLPEHSAVAEVPKPSDIADIEAPLANDPRNLWCLGYGLDRFDKLFTSRQLTALVTFSDLVPEARAHMIEDARTAGGWVADDRGLEAEGMGATAYADAVATYLGIGIDKMLDYNCTMVTWINQRDQAGHAFSKQALPMIWDYVEVNPFVGAAGDLTISLAGIARVVEATPASAPSVVCQQDAATAIEQSISFVGSTDPPYYDNIGYADLSDFFYVWSRRSIGKIMPSLFATMLTPKSPELIASPYRHEGDASRAREFFESGFSQAFSLLQSGATADYPVTIYYGFKQAEGAASGLRSAADGVASTGWETMLNAVIASGFTVDGTWPMRTERSTRSVGQGTNALASSIVLTCRKRSSHSPLSTRREFLNALKQELPNALRHLQQGNIAPVDLAQAAIGPGMAVFTRYAKVMEADGTAMTVRTALALINQSLDEVLAEQEGEFDADTRWAIAWFEENGIDEGPYGIAETLSKAKNTAVKGLEEAGIIRAKSGKVRLVARDELSDNWDPATDKRLTQWEVVQHLIRALDTGGELAAAELLRKLGGLAETARDLAYRLYSLCERKKWAQEALAYNGLVTAWPEIDKLARASRADEVKQQTLL